MMQPSDLLQQDLANREQAVRWQQPMPSYIVEAPAGAGKTELLTQRFLMLLPTVQHPEEVVAITFTNKAAAEMRERILSSLQMAHAGLIPEPAHKKITYQLALKALQQSQQRAWDLLQHPARLRIITIDALSAQLARQMPLMSRFGGQPEVLQEASRLYQQAANNTLQLLDDAERGAAVYRALQYFNNDATQLAELLSHMLAKRDQWLDYQGNSITLQQSEQALRCLIQQDLQQALAILTAPIQAVLKPIARFAASNPECSPSIAVLAEWQDDLSTDLSQLPLWQGLMELLMTDKNQFRQNWNKNQGLPAGELGKAHKQGLADSISALALHACAIPVFTRVRSLPQAESGAYGQAMVQSLNQLLTLAYAQLWLLFQQQGKVDFVEISQRAIAALSDEHGLPSELAMRLDFQIQHLLVDEFQDTSPSQIALIEKLTAEWQQGDGRSLFLVGDPMQSIYRFRKANVGLFLRAQHFGIGNVALTPLRLYQNNRSEPKLIAWINHTFAQVFPAQDSIAQGAIQYRPFVQCKPDSADSGVVIHPFITKQAQQAVEDSDTSEDEAQALSSPARMREAHRIIDIIQQTRAQQPQAKIAVLVRARGQLSVLVSQIRRYYPALTFQAVEIEELANRQVVQDLLSLCHALHHRADRVHWLAVLRAPWCGLKLATLHDLIADDRHSLVLDLMHDTQRLMKLEPDERQRLQYVRDILSMALQQQGRMSTSRWLRSTWLMLNGPHCLWKQSDAVDVEAFFERMDAIEREGAFSMAELTREVEKLYAQPDVTAPDTLQFMTIHKSKGLEFDTVILPGLDFSGVREDAALMLWEEYIPDQSDSGQAQVVVAPYVPKSQLEADNDRQIYRYLQQFDKTRAIYEDMRVLYVAATRAQRKLHLLGAVKQNQKGEINPTKDTFLAMLWPQLSQDFYHALAADDAPDQSLPLPSAASLATFIPRLIRLPHVQLAPVLQPASSSFEPAEPAEMVMLPDSAQDGLGAAPASVMGVGVDVGVLTHRYLQWIAEQGLAHWPVSRVQRLLPAMQQWMLARGHALSLAQQAAQSVQHMLIHALDNAQIAWLLQAHTEARSEYALEQVQADGGIKRWVIDRTFISEGVRWIVDYKTDTVSPQLSSAQWAESHRPQLTQYAQLFAHEGKPIKLVVVLLSVPSVVVL